MTTLKSRERKKSAKKKVKEEETFKGTAVYAFTMASKWKDHRTTDKRWLLAQKI